MIHSFQAMQALSHPPGESTDLCSGIPCQGAGLCLVLVRAWDQCLVMNFFPLQSPVNFQETQKLLSGSESYRPDVVELARTWAREKWERKRVKFCKRNLDIQVNAFLAAHRYKVCCLPLPGFSICSLNGQFCGRLNMKILMRLTQFKSPILFPQDLKSNFEIVQSTDCAE